MQEKEQVPKYFKSAFGALLLNEVRVPKSKF